MILLVGLFGGASATPPEERASRWLPLTEVSRKRTKRAGDQVGAPPVPEWQVRLPGPPLNSATHTERSRPVVVEDRIYVGSAAGKALYVLDRQSGSLIGQFAAGSSVEAEPLLVDGLVIFSDTSGTTWCYRIDEPNEPVWSHKSNAPILTAPVLADGRVFITNVDDLGLALDVKTGRQIWRHKAKRDLTRFAELALYAAPAVLIDGDEAIFGFSSGEVIGLGAETGEVRWSLAVGEGRYPDIVATPVRFDEDIFVSGYFKPLVAIDRAQHQPRWRTEFGAAFPVSIDTESGTVFHPGSDGTLRAYSALTGALKWTWDSGTTTALTTPVITPAGLFVGASAGSIHLVDASTGLERWTWREPELLDGITSTPTVIDDQILFVTNAGYLRSLTVPQSSGKRLEHRWFQTSNR